MSIERLKKIEKDIAEMITTKLKDEIFESITYIMRKNDDEDEDYDDFGM